MTRSSPASVTIFNCLSPSLESEMSSAPCQTVFGFGIHIRDPYMQTYDIIHPCDGTKKEKKKRRKDEGTEENKNKHEIHEHLIPVLQID